MSSAGGRMAVEPGGATPYAPISGLAVAALIVATVATAILAAIGVGARVSGKPSTEPLLILPAVVGFVLAIAARWQIRASQGARTGMRLATAAWWMSILAGGSYAAYFIANELALRAQAKRFTLEWFNKVANGTPEAAFIDSLEPATRQSIDPADVDSIRTRFSKDLHSFRINEIVRQLQRAGADHEITPRGLQGWELMEGGYLVKQTFDIRTPEGRFEVMIPAYGRDSAELGGRTWRMLYHRAQQITQQYTTLGQLIMELLFDQKKFLAYWVDNINRKNLFEAYLDTLPLADREAASKNPESPGLRQFEAGSLIRVDGQQPTPEDLKKFTAEFFRPYALNHVPGNAQMPVGPPALTITPTSIRFDNMIEINSVADGRPVVANVAVLLEAPDLIAEIQKLRTGDWKAQEIRSQPKLDSPSELGRYPNRRYRVIEVNIRPNAPRLAATPGPGG
jgi:hypothetical protein